MNKKMGFILPLLALFVGSTGLAEQPGDYRFPRECTTTPAGYPVPLCGRPLTKTPVVVIDRRVFLFIVTSSLQKVSDIINFFRDMRMSPLGRFLPFAVFWADSLHSKTMLQCDRRKSVRSSRSSSRGNSIEVRSLRRRSISP